MNKDKRYDSNFLFFDEGPHRYTDSLGNEYKSVTTIIHDNYVPMFDKEYWARKKAKEQGVSVKAIKEQWERITKEACERGTNTHNGIEDAIKDVSMFKNAIRYLESVGSGRCITIADIPNLIPVPLDIEKFKEATNNKYPEIYRVFDFYVSRGYTIYSEIGAYLIDYLISGTIDILCIRDNDFVILDWKTNRDGLKFEAGYYKKDKSVVPNQLTSDWVRKSEFMLPPLNHLPNCNGMHYSMQLSIYALMTELILGIPCVGLGLCHIASSFVLNDYGQPKRFKDGYHVIEGADEIVNWYRINYLKNEAIAVLRDRELYLKANKQDENKQLTLFG